MFELVGNRKKAPVLISFHTHTFFSLCSIFQRYATSVYKIWTRTKS